MRMLIMRHGCLWLTVVLLAATATAQQNVLGSLDVSSLQQRAQAGDAEAQAELGDRYLKGGALWDPMQALNWDTKSAEQGNARGEYLLGMLYGMQRIGTLSPDQGQSTAWLEKAAQQGYVPAELALGFKFGNGMEVCQDLTRSAMWLRRAAEQGNAQAQWGIGDAYEFGKGVPRDLDEARNWYQKAADQNYDEAKSKLRLLSSPSHGSMAAPPKTVMEKPVDGCIRGTLAWKVLAELGDPKAEANVAMGLEESGDYAEALVWDLRASDYWGSGESMADYHSVKDAVHLYNPSRQETPNQLAARLGSVAQGDSGAAGDFRTMPSAKVLRLLLNADQVKAELRGTSFPPHDKKDPEWAKSCNGMKSKDSVVRAYAGENACFQVFTHYARDAFADFSNTANLNYVVNALVRGCGLYAPSQDKAYRGRTCGLLGRTLYGIGNTDAAKAVWELAPGCYSQDERTGSPLNGCVNVMTGGDGQFFRGTTLKSYGALTQVFRGEPQRLVRLMFQSCTTIHDRDSCSFLQQNGANVDMAAVEQAENERHEALEEFRAERRADSERERAAAEERRNAIFGALASMGGSNSTAVLDAGNQQAAALRALGNANATRVPMAGGSSNMQASNATGSSTRGNSGTGNSGATQDGTSGGAQPQPQAMPQLPPNCLLVSVKLFYPDQPDSGMYYGVNNCGLSINVDIAMSSGYAGAQSFQAGGAGFLGASANMGAYKVWYCAYPYWPSDPNNHPENGPTYSAAINGAVCRDPSNPNSLNGNASGVTK